MDNYSFGLKSADQIVLGVGPVSHNPGLPSLLQASNNDFLDLSCSATTDDLLQLEEITDELLMTQTQFPQNIQHGMQTGYYVAPGLLGMDKCRAQEGKQRLQEAVFENSPNDHTGDNIFPQTIQSANSPPRIVHGQNMHSQCKESAKKDSDNSEEINNNNDNDDRNHRFRRTPKQQQQNKQAQQRYRQRKKQRFQDMEGTIELLNQRVQQLQNMESLNQQLVLQQVEADRLMKSKDEEIKWLRNQISANSNQLQNVRIINKSCNNSIDIQQQQMMNQKQQYMQQQQQQQILVQNYDNRGIHHFNESLKESFYRSVLKIRTFLEESNILQLHEYGKVIPEQKNSECQQLIKQACDNCARLLSEDASCIVEIIHQYAATNKQQKSLIRVIQQLKITLQQKQILQQLGKTQIQRLKQLYQERYKINQEIVNEINNSNQQILTQNQHFAHNRGYVKDEEIYADYVIQSIEEGGYFQNCGYQLRILKLARELKSNVRNEYKYMLQLNRFVVGQVFTPIQASIYVVSLFPQHCDVFPLANQLLITD